MFRVSVLCLVALCCLLCTTDAAITAWTNPVITSASGSGPSTQAIPESQAVGVTPVTIAATSAGTKVYAIASQPTTGKLTINSASGLLSLATGTFDFETAPTYILTITCVDTDGATVTTGTATVTLSITNVNEAPVFASSQYAATIPDGSTAGTTLTTVKATDPDAGNTLTYTIDTGNTGAVFTIGASTGIITVASSKTTNAATAGGFQLSVKATDSAGTPLSDTTTVWVAVKTCSSNAAALIASVVTMMVAFVASLQ